MGRRPERQVLRGMKEIAAFFDAHPNTIQTWEKKWGLPLHRKPRLMAIREELMAWVRR